MNRLLAAENEKVIQRRQAESFERRKPLIDEFLALTQSVSEAERQELFAAATKRPGWRDRLAPLLQRYGKPHLIGILED